MMITLHYIGIGIGLGGVVCWNDGNDDKKIVYTLFSLFSHSFSIESKHFHWENFPTQRRTELTELNGMTCKLSLLC